jgi:serine/threonine protein kinase
MAEGHHNAGERRSLLARVQFEQLRAGLGFVAEQRRIPIDPERRFEIERVIGSGGMGVVYLGYDTKLSRRVALKVVRGHANELSQLEIRLQREARVLATLRDRNVLAIFDIGRAQSGELFIATEYVDGPTLREWQKGRPWSEVLPVYLEAGRGLAAAHAMQIVHRDFKPDNVLIEPRSPPRVFVGDFGLASESDVDVSTPKHRHRPVQSDPALLGTLEYMAPEQRACLPATASSDQFAFCVSLWEAWTGSRPCLVDDRPPDRPNRMPRKLYRLLAIGLSPRPEHRHPSLAALLEQLVRDQRRQYEHRAIAFVGALLGLSIATSYSFGRRLPTAAIEQPPTCQLQQTDEFWNPDVEAQLRHDLAGHPQRYADALADVVVRLLTANSRARHQLAYETCEQRRSMSDNRLLDQRETCIDRWRRQTAMQIDLLLELDADELRVQRLHITQAPRPAVQPRAPRPAERRLVVPSSAG